jgi:hypothetical protein
MPGKRPPLPRSGVSKKVRCRQSNRQRLAPLAGPGLADALAGAPAARGRPYGLCSGDLSFAVSTPRWKSPAKNAYVFVRAVNVRTTISPSFTVTM